MTVPSTPPNGRPSHQPRVQLGLALVIGVASAAGCGELREDGDYMCVVPVDCAPVDVGETCLNGTYPADTPLTVRVWAAASPIEISKQRCWAEITGEFELTVNSRWRERDLQDSGERVHFDCTTPALAAGVWTVVFGDEQLELHVPSTYAPVACMPEPGF